MNYMNTEAVVVRQLAFPVSAFDYLKERQRDYEQETGQRLNNVQVLTRIMAEHRQAYAPVSATPTAALLKAPVRCPMSQQTSMQLFQFQDVDGGRSIALSALEKDGQAWFVANDVCAALGLHRTATRRLDEDEKGVHKTHTLGGLQQVAIINESGLYSLIFSSNKEEAKRFKKWVTSVVIPSIRQHGGYINGQEGQALADQAQTLQVIQKEAQRVGLNCAEEKEARREAFKLMSGGRSYGPGGRKGLRGARR